MKEGARTSAALAAPTPQAAAVLPPRRPDPIAQAARQRAASEPTSARLPSRVAAYVLFHGKRPPRDLGAIEVAQFRNHLAVQGWVSACTQNEALNTLVFPYQQVLGIEVSPEGGRAEAAHFPGSPLSAVAFDPEAPPHKCGRTS